MGVNVEVLTPNGELIAQFLDEDDAFAAALSLCVRPKFPTLSRIDLFGDSTCGRDALSQMARELEILELQSMPPDVTGAVHHVLECVHVALAREGSTVKFLGD